MKRELPERLWNTLCSVIKGIIETTPKFEWCNISLVFSFNIFFYRYGFSIQLIRHRMLSMQCIYIWCVFWTSALPQQQIMNHECTFYAKFTVLDYSLDFTDYFIIEQWLNKLKCVEKASMTRTILNFPYLRSC